MANKKCFVCKKTVYAMERIRVGDNDWHKWCFKCETCQIKLDLRSFKNKDDRIYCVKCVPMPAASQAADRMDMSNAKNAGELQRAASSVNDNVRGELAGQASKEGTDSMGIGKAVNAPKLATVNEQKRGELAGIGGQIDNESMGIKNAVNAPKRDTVNEQKRGELAGVGGQIDNESMGIKNAVNAPKRGGVNEQVRGELAGQGRTGNTY
eukprot:CAMPEP_0201515202 /NCGR_PEP_ID=MMETSP0161_2-20130828/6836_1 /ASSEMBLY_ACC=CAM_ASM_000251 /TAXON_ID=180227 /ORGANISM="Neoparamoeba aestuarina, Strain SoJaBio B1-5/56/2" /LENGTH=208 /DNA_ID=CAMNT_0047911969 /DNA_START=65 /DNA_END=691 /DNA_ORIENTATION=+